MRASLSKRRAATFGYLRRIVAAQAARLSSDVTSGGHAHPWIAMAYRLDCDGGSVCYVTDTAPFRDILIEQEYIRQPPKPGDPMKPEDAAKLRAMRDGVVRLCEGADLVIYDTQ